jgi:hypothetical protein
MGKREREDPEKRFMREYRRAVGLPPEQAPVDPLRGSGRSHRAIELLPRLAVYVTPGETDYWYEMSRAMGRHDVTLVAHHDFMEWVHRYREIAVVGHFSTVYFDHAVQESAGPTEWEKLMFWLERMQAYLTRYPDDEV